MSNSVKDAINAAYYPWHTREFNAARFPSMHETFATGFEAGAAWGIHTSSALSPHLAQLIELLVLLGFQRATDAEETPHDCAEVMRRTGKLCW